MQLPSLPLFTSGTAKSGTFNQLRDVVAVLLNPPAAMIRSSGTAQSITSGGSYQLVTFPTTEYDTEPDVLVTSTSRLTAKTAGRYRVAATATFSANGTGDRYIQVRKNAAGSAAGGSQVVSATAKPSSGSSCTVSTNSALEVQLSVGDTIEAFVFQDSGASLTLNTGPGDTFLTVRLVSVTASLSAAAADSIGSVLAETALGTSDLDAVKTPGNYVQGTAADATLARHYPVATVTGHLQVTSDGAGSPALVHQVWTSSSTNDTYVRTYSAAAWSAWEAIGGGGGVTDHGALTGLADNDHPQYLLVADAAETVRDTMGTALVAGSGVTITPDDAGDTITIAASGSAAATGYPELPLKSGKWTQNGAGGGTNVTGNTTGECHYIPFVAGDSVTLASVAVNVATAAAASTTSWVGIFAHNTTTGWPGARLADLGTIAVDSTGIKTVTTTLAVTAGTVYWIGVEIGGGRTFTGNSLNGDLHVPDSRATPTVGVGGVEQYSVLATTSPTTASPNQAHLGKALWVAVKA